MNLGLLELVFFIIKKIGLSYALESFMEHGITTPTALMNLSFEDFDERIYLFIYY